MEEVAEEAVVMAAASAEERSEAEGRAEAASATVTREAMAHSAVKVATMVAAGWVQGPQVGMLVVRADRSARGIRPPSNDESHRRDSVESSTTRPGSVCDGHRRSLRSTWVDWIGC